ncbi:hypothetical protein K458DRAFT_439178 [Lentithecium fluviatile CBS 122367]|uniref:Uncharacterized protein n=1 Tax=Lentithecium fluviatile CBS 122367 TaxID=1168545 RepID=A0A6G1JIU0_9PLEO|nr:hypothetical protein K458DRAFT_439178 [Lentithecium fluviatile CBS 122367]
MGYAPVNWNAHNAPEEQWNDVQLQPYSSHPASLYSTPSGPPPDVKGYAESEHSLLEHSKGWPVQSQRIWTITPFRAFMMCFDVILASGPIMFIAARLDGHEVSPYGQHLRQALLLSPTIFPVISAALMGRCFRSIGLFLAERGTTLGRLEQLIGCNSLFSALERQIALRSWSIVGLILAVLWLLSALGGQSALRLLGQEDASTWSNGTFQYLNPIAIEDSSMMGASAANSGRSTFTSIFLAALLTSTSYGSTAADLGENVKMPAYSSIENTAPGEWKLVPDANSTNITYASLIGIPVANIDKNGQSNFSIKARQWDITCDSNQRLLSDKADFGNQTATWKMDYTDHGCTQYPCKISFKSIAGRDKETTLDDDNIYTVASCELFYEYLETIVNCNRTSYNYSSDMDGFTRSTLTSNTMKFLITVDSYGVGSKWMMDPNNFIGASSDSVKLYEPSLDVLATRLTVVFNAFWQSTYATLAIGGNLPNNLTSLADNSPFLTFNDTSASILSPSPPVYKTNWTWVTALFVSSIILQIAAYIGLVLKYYTCVSDITGYASSMTLLNPYVPTPTGGTTLHRLKRAALLQDMPVRIGTADEGQVGRLDWRRLYI